MRKVLIFALMLGTTAVPAISQRSTTEARRVQVVSPGSLPDIARQAGQSMDLHAVGNGTVLLYIEQAELKRVAIVDVTDPAHIKAVGVEPVAEETFDFVRSMDGRSTLLRFRDSGGFAVMDYKVPMHPKVVQTPVQQSSRSEAIGDGLLLITEGKPLPVLPSRNYQVMDSGSPGQPQLVATVPEVQQVVKRGDTGTTFLVGNEGLTVIRQPRVERESRAVALAQY